MRKTRIVCTIGPQSASVAGIKGLAGAGMNVARLNGSHNTLDWHAKTVLLIRSVDPTIPILFDIPGSKIRTSNLAHEPEFDAGDTIVLTTDQASGGLRRVPVGSDVFHRMVAAGDIILADDGRLRFAVISVDGRDVTCRAEIAGKLRSRKGLNIPTKVLPWKPLRDADRQMVAFAMENDIDYVGISFVEFGEHVRAIRDLTRDGFPRIVAKIETERGYHNREDVLEAADAVMIDRGDLAVETSLETMAIYQKEILSTARKYSKPVIVATEMLHSMIEQPTPTKAEISDISNAALDGASAVMLSGETAVGPYGVAAVEVMDRVLASVERYRDGHKGATLGATKEQLAAATGVAIAELCNVLAITKVVAVTVSGFAARMVASNGVPQPVIAVSNQAAAARSFNLLPGTTGVFVDIPFSRTGTEHIPLCLEALWRMGLVDETDTVLVTGLTYPHSGSRMNMISIHSIRDLSETLDWLRGSDRHNESSVA